MGDAMGELTGAVADVRAVGYFVFRSPAWDAWMSFAGRMVRADLQTFDDESWARLRLDDRVQRILLERVEGAPSFAIGLEAVDAAALERLALRLESQGTRVSPGDPAECARRGVERFVWFSDPDGNRIEAFVGLAGAERPLAPSRPIGGFRTGAQGVGHIVFSTPRLREMSAFYRGTLGALLSDFCHDPFEAEFLRLNPRHHSIALVGGSRAGIHHVMLEYLDWDDVGRAYDVALETPDDIGQTLGRHSNDLMTSFYAYTPDRFMMELGWAGRLCGDDWVVEELTGPSLWGHERYWLPPERRERARQVRDVYSQRGVIQPVSMAGDHERDRT